MNWSDTARTGLQALRAHRLRSALTVLGILIGIATVVLSVGLGQGSKSSVDASISALGSNLLVVSPGSTTSSSGVRGGQGSASTLTVADATALGSKAAAPDVKAVAPAVLRHRLILTPEAQVAAETPDRVLARALAQVEVPR